MRCWRGWGALERPGQCGESLWLPALNRRVCYSPLSPLPYASGTRLEDGRGVFYRVTPCFFFVCALLLTPVAAASEQAASSVVNAFHETLTDVMRASDKLGFSGRRDKLDLVINEHFDLSLISRVVTGRFWKSMDEVQREQMVQTFTELTVATYASRFDSYSGERFRIAETRELKKDRLLIRSELVKSDGDVVQLDYVLHQRNDSWQIINVIADGVSDLSIKRADYARVFSDSGFDGLIGRLNTQIDELSQSS